MDKPDPEIHAPRAARLADLDPTPYGANCHLAHDELIAEPRGIGVTWQRFDIDWNDLEPEQGVFACGEPDRCLAQAARLGVSVFATVAYTPRWASGRDDRTAPPRSGAAFVRFVRDAVRRYRGKLHALGVWNEPNLREFYTGTREFYPRELLVCAGILERRTGPDELADVSAQVRAGRAAARAADMLLSREFRVRLLARPADRH